MTELSSANGDEKEEKICTSEVELGKAQCLFGSRSAEKTEEHQARMKHGVMATELVVPPGSESESH